MVDIDRIHFAKKPYKKRKTRMQQQLIDIIADKELLKHYDDCSQLSVIGEFSKCECYERHIWDAAMRAAAKEISYRGNRVSDPEHRVMILMGVTLIENQMMSSEDVEL